MIVPIVTTDAIVVIATTIARVVNLCDVVAWLLPKVNILLAATM